VAMGITGTDVSKEAADMILTDDNFASIVSAVGEGRIIYANIRKVVAFLISCNVGEILVIFFAMLFGMPMPLAAIHLLAINLITDAFPAFALGMEKGESGVMSQPPRDPAEPIVDRRMGVAIVIQSIFLAVGTLASFAYSYYAHGDFDSTVNLEIACTACFVTIVLGELLRAYTARSEVTSIFRMKILDNTFLNWSVLASVVFLFIIVYVPFLNPIFKTLPLRADELLIAIALAFVAMMGGEIAKFVKIKEKKSIQA